MASGGKVINVTQTAHQPFANFPEKNGSTAENVEMSPATASASTPSVSEGQPTSVAVIPKEEGAAATENDESWRDTLHLLESEVTAALAQVRKSDVDVSVGRASISHDRAAVVLSWNKATSKLQSNVDDGEWLNGENGDNGLLLYLAIRFKDDRKKLNNDATDSGGCERLGAESEAETDVVNDVGTAGEIPSSNNDENNNANESQTKTLQGATTDITPDDEISDKASDQEGLDGAVVDAVVATATGVESSAAPPSAPSPDDSGVGNEEALDNHVASENGAVDDSSVSSRDSFEKSKKPKKSVRWRERLEETSEDESVLKSKGKRDTSSNKRDSKDVPSNRVLTESNRASASKEKPKDYAIGKKEPSAIVADPGSDAKPKVKQTAADGDSGNDNAPPDSPDSVIISDIGGSSRVSSSAVAVNNESDKENRGSDDFERTRARLRSGRASQRQRPPVLQQREQARPNRVEKGTPSRRVPQSAGRPTTSRSRSSDPVSARADYKHRRRPISTERPSAGTPSSRPPERSRSNSPSSPLPPPPPRSANYREPIAVLSSKPPDELAGKLRERTLPDLRNVIRRLRVTHVPARRANLWFGPGKECDRSFNSRISDRFDLSELDEDSKHYFYFRSLPKVSPATTPAPSTHMQVASVSETTTATATPTPPSAAEQPRDPEPSTTPPASASESSEMTATEVSMEAPAEVPTPSVASEQVNADSSNLEANNAPELEVDSNAP